MTATTKSGRRHRRIGIRIVGAAAVLLVASACGSEPGSPDPIAAGSSSTTVVATSAPGSTAPARGPDGSSTTTMSSTAPEPPSREARTISIDALGPLSLGITRSEVEALDLGVGDVGCGSLRSITGAAGELTASFDDAGVITGASTTDAAFETLAGIRVGATEADLRAAYGTNLVGSTIEGNVGPVDAFQLRSEQALAADRYVWFTMIDGRVGWIALLGGDADPGALLC